MFINWISVNAESPSFSFIKKLDPDKNVLISPQGNKCEKFANIASPDLNKVIYKSTKDKLISYFVLSHPINLTDFDISFITYIDTDLSIGTPGEQGEAFDYLFISTISLNKIKHDLLQSLSYGQYRKIPISGNGQKLGNELPYFENQIDLKAIDSPSKYFLAYGILIKDRKEDCSYIDAIGKLIQIPEPDFFISHSPKIVTIKKDDGEKIIKLFFNTTKMFWQNDKIHINKVWSDDNKILTIDDNIPRDLSFSDGLATVSIPIETDSIPAGAANININYTISELVFNVTDSTNTTKDNNATESINPLNNQPTDRGNNTKDNNATESINPLNNQPTDRGNNTKDNNATESINPLNNQPTDRGNNTKDNNATESINLLSNQPTDRGNVTESINLLSNQLTDRGNNTKDNNATESINPLNNQPTDRGNNTKDNNATESINLLSNQPTEPTGRDDVMEGVMWTIANYMPGAIPRTDNNVPQSYPEIQTEINYLPQESAVYKIPVNIDKSRTWWEWTQYWAEYTWQKFGGIISLVAPTLGATILIIWKKISQTTRTKEIDKNKSQTGSPLP
jgi:hypothetical protein